MVIIVAGGERGPVDEVELHALQDGCAGATAWLEHERRQHRREI
jgi:hypothetical protein